MKQQEQQGVNVRKLRPGTKLEIYTHNSLYEVEITNAEGHCVVVGGKHVLHPRQGRYVGGVVYKGGPIRLGWIGPYLGMEFFFNRNYILTTSGVRKVRIIGDGWDYDMDWENPDSL